MADIYRSFEWIVANKAPLRSFGEAFYPGKRYYRFESINLALSDDGETVDMVLGELVFAPAEKPKPAVPPKA